MALPILPLDTILSTLKDCPISPTTLAEDLYFFLLKLPVSPKPYIHPRVISFSSIDNRKAWEVSKLPDALYRDVFSTFYNRGKQGNSTWIGLFSIPTGTAMGNDWEDAPWHCFTVAIISRKEGGKALIIWDCDPVPVDPKRSRIKHILWGRQLAFTSYIRKRCPKVEVWYNTDSRYTSRGRCLPYSLAMVRKWALLGDFKFEGREDPRVEGCVRIPRW